MVLSRSDGKEYVQQQYMSMLVIPLTRRIEYATSLPLVYGQCTYVVLFGSCIFTMGYVHHETTIFIQNKCTPLSGDGGIIK